MYIKISSLSVKYNYFSFFLNESVVCFYIFRAVLPNPFAWWAGLAVLGLSGPDLVHLVGMAGIVWPVGGAGWVQAGSNAAWQGEKSLTQPPRGGRGGGSQASQPSPTKGRDVSRS